MCRGEMRSSLGVVKLGILHLRLSRGAGRARGVGSSGAVVSCLGGDGGRTPPKILWLQASLHPLSIFTLSLYKGDEKLRVFFFLCFILYL